MRKRFRIIAEFFHLLAVRAQQDRLFQVAGSLTFTTLLALVPLLTVALTVFSAFPMFADFSSAIRSFVLANLVPAAAGKVVTVYAEQFTQNTGKLTALGMLLLTIAAVMTMLTIDRTFNTIWRVRRPRSLVSRLLIYWGVLTIGPLLIGASLYVTSWLLTRSMGLVGPSEAVSTIYRLVPLILTILAFSFLYRTIPNRPVAVHDAVMGGILAGLLFEAAKAAFGAYIRQVPMYKLVYGAFASIPIFLIWIYISWMIILLGAVFAAALPYLRNGGVRVRKALGAELLDALALMHLLYNAHLEGHVLHTDELRARVRLPHEQCEELLERLARPGWVARAAGETWVLARDAGEIRLADVYGHFVFDPDAMRREHSEESFENAIVTLAAGVHDKLTITLKALFTRQNQK